MPVNTQTTRNQYDGSGSTGPYAFTFKIFAASDLLVILADPDKALTNLTLNTDFTISGVGNDTGSVTLTSPLATGYTLTLLRNMPYTQGQNWIDLQSFTASAANATVDKLCMMIQQVLEKAQRSIRLTKDYQPNTVGLTVRADPLKYLRWNAYGTAIENADVAGTGDVTAIGDILTALQDMASDSKITPTDKWRLALVWLVIQNEYTGLVTQANLLTISHADLDTAYNALSYYLLTTIGVFDDMGASTDIVRTVFDGMFSDYESARDDLKAAMLNSAHTKADDALEQLTGQSADGKIGRKEKRDDKARWDAIVTEGKSTTGTLCVQADSVGVSRTAFNSAYAALNTYLNSDLHLFSDMTTATTIDATEWNTTWKAYIDARTALIIAITNKVQGNVAIADAHATAALTALDNMAADNKLTPLEKLDLYQRWLTAMALAQPTTGRLIVQAAAFGVSSSDLATKYAALNTYLNTTLLCGATPGVFSDMSVTTTCVRATFDSKWTDYWDSVELLRNAIATASKTRLDNWTYGGTTDFNGNLIHAGTVASATLGIPTGTQSQIPPGGMVVQFLSTGRPYWVIARADMATPDEGAILKKDGTTKGQADGTHINLVWAGLTDGGSHTWMLVGASGGNMTGGVIKLIELNGG